MATQTAGTSTKTSFSKREAEVYILVKKAVRWLHHRFAQGAGITIPLAGRAMLPPLAAVLEPAEQASQQREADVED